MADEPPGGGERTQAPTARRLEQAREKGDRLASRELATALTGIAGAGWLWAWAGDLAAAAHSSAAGALSIGRADLVDFRPADAIVAMLAPLAPPLLALAGLLLVAAVAGQALGGGVSFTPGLIAPKADRLDPLKGLARSFGPRGLLELVKALMKAAILIGVSAFLLNGDMAAILALSAMPLEAALASAMSMSLALLLWLSLGLAFIAAVDLPVQIRLWMKRLRMSLQEVKEEMRQQEGSPEVKHALRRMARESLKHANRAAMADASVVLTNPTHFAVALRYRPGEDAAPVIVARGRGPVAEAILELARERGVMVLAYPSIARALYFTGRVGQSIRTDLYAAVATILAFVLRHGGEGAPPEAEAPPSARYDETGRRAPPP